MSFTSFNPDSPALSQHDRSNSETTLVNMHLDNYVRIVRPPRISSRVADEDLEALCTPLGKSVVEEEEERFAVAAQRALSHLQSPDGQDCFSPFDSATEVPDVDDYNYFHSKKHYSTSSHDRLNRYASSSSSSNSTCSTPGSSWSSISDSPSEAWTPPTTSRSSSPSLSKSYFSAIASRRGVAPDALHLSPSPHSRPKFVRVSSNLQNNFAGLEALLVEGSDKPLEIDAPLTPRLRTRRCTGFAF